MNSDKSGAKVVSCPGCKRFYRLSRRAALAPGTRLRCTKCGHVFALEGAPSPPPPKPRGPAVLVASDGEEVRALIEEVLISGGFAPHVVSEGGEAWEQIRLLQPRATVLDVALPGMPVFEICDRIRKDPEHSKLAVILLASVYQHTRYKRSPTSLYGADDYIEKHHLRDSLVDKISRLLPAKMGTAAASTPARREEESRPASAVPPVEEAKQEEETMVHEEQFGSLAEPAAAVDPRHESLRRFARIIISDIALYNQEQVEEGIRQGTLHQLLAKEIAEGRNLFQTRLQGSSAVEEAFFNEAMEEFEKKQKTRFFGEGDPGGGAG